MSIPIITFFNNKGGVGKTSLVYHLAWMFSEKGLRVVAVDLDPQSNLTSAFIHEKKLEELWEGSPKTDAGTTMYKCLEPLTKAGDLRDAVCFEVTDTLRLIPGDLRLAGFEDSLSEAWPHSMGSREPYRPFRILSAFWSIGQKAAQGFNADLILADVGPNLGAINRSALIASDSVVIPLSADLFSLQGLKNLGPTLRNWREEWKKRLKNWTEREFDLPDGQMQPIGYVVHQHGIRLDRPVRAYDTWIERIPDTYRRYVLQPSKNSKSQTPAQPSDDPYCLATIKHFRSLVPLAQDARKPIFHLTSADGAIGAHATAAKEAGKNFGDLADRILKEIGIPWA